ncbi:hypothetical protein TSUD_288970 [Trifolium subterraneum]|uniref:PABC domain-containing protein n=1 Tax=Trifolium subterraneum TaxID=3900 RepID=A0A2Z6MNH0_TRISU|nr:hypothetical protein TSUD_288970 [Trifolium subterraneum]
MNGKIIEQKPLYVAVAERKEQRKARLQARFSQIQAMGGIAPMPAGIVGYHPGAQRIAPQQLYFGQATPGVMSPQPAGYGFQQPFMPSMQSSVAPNFTMPYHHQRQGHLGHRMAGRRVGNFQQVQQNQMHNSNQEFRYNGRNDRDLSVDSEVLIGKMMDPSVVAATPIDNELHSELSNKTLSSTLASASPEIQQMMLGEHLLPLVSRLTLKDQAAKVTGMLLEMDQAEVIHLIETPDELKIKVSEAMQVLHEASPSSEVNDQPGSL